MYSRSYAFDIAPAFSCSFPITSSEAKDYAREQVENARLSGAFVTDKGQFVYIKRVFYNYPATVVIWSDGTKTVSKCADENNYSEEAGLVLCILKKIVGSTPVRQVIQDWLPAQYYDGDAYGNAVVDVKDVRNKYK